MTTVTYREITDADFESVRALLVNDAPNQWNHLPEAEIQFELTAIRSKRGSAIVASDGANVVGYCVFLFDDFINPEAHKFRTCETSGQIGNVVVAKDQRNRGIAKSLLQASLDDLRNKGTEEVFIERHAEHASMQKVLASIGFDEVITYADDARRSSGSCETTISKFVFPEV